MSEQTIRDRIADDVLPGVTMVGGAWRIPVSSLRILRPASSGASEVDAERPTDIQHLIERLEAFGTGMIPCPDAARIAGIGIKAMPAAD